MVRKAFGIYGDDLNTGSLYIETGHDYIACSLMDTEQDRLKAFELFHFDSSDADAFEKLFSDAKLFSRLLSESNSTVQLIWANEKAVCVPAEYFSAELATAMLETMHAVASPMQYSVNRSGDIVVVGYIPAKAAAVYAANLNISANEHKYFQLLNAQHKKENRHVVYLVFDHSDFTYAVYKEGVLQLIQTQQYKTSEDVVYHLLNAFQAFEMPVSEVDIAASGMIDDSSPLYKNLRAYFHHFAFQQMDESKFAAEGFKEYPLHYFASFCQ